eukprot:9537875-Ditylum_brightwellii.AAC.1
MSDPVYLSRSSCCILLVNVSPLMVSYAFRDGNITGVVDGARPGGGLVQKELTSASAMTFNCASS